MGACAQTLRTQSCVPGCGNACKSRYVTRVWQCMVFDHCMDCHARTVTSAPLGHGRQRPSGSCRWDPDVQGSAGLASQGPAVAAQPSSNARGPACGTRTVEAAPSRAPQHSAGSAGGRTGWARAPLPAGHRCPGATLPRWPRQLRGGRRRPGRARTTSPAAPTPRVRPPGPTCPACRLRALYLPVACRSFAQDGRARGGAHHPASLARAPRKRSHHTCCSRFQAHFGHC